jgi:TetR/AcrR family transcriptional regulator, cholesterol catabolism regulator
LWAKVSIPVKEKLLEDIRVLFFRFGIKSVTMDDIARELGISKKTIYQYFKNKDDLVNQIFSSFFETTQMEILGIVRQSPNAIDEWIKLSRYHNKFLNDFNPSVIYDARKYYPTCWQQFEKHKLEFMNKLIISNLKRGMDEGIYRKNIDPDILSRFHIYKMEMLADNTVTKGLSKSNATLLNEITEYHLRGVASAKGILLLEKTKIDY